MTQPFFPCTISAQSRNNEFLTIKTVVRKTHQNNGHTGSSCLDKAVLAQGGGGGYIQPTAVGGYPTANDGCWSTGGGWPVRQQLAVGSELLVPGVLS